MRWFRPLRTKLAPRLARGRRAEQLACTHLQAQGYTILERNARYPVGEIDIVAQEGSTLCFVEVRSTGSQQWGGPLASITDRKRRHLINAARWYLQYSRTSLPEIRFDVVAIDWQARGPAIELIRGAFTTDVPF